MDALLWHCCNMYQLFGHDTPSRQNCHSDPSWSCRIFASKRPKWRQGVVSSPNLRSRSPSWSNNWWTPLRGRKRSKLHGSCSITVDGSSHTYKNMWSHMVTCSCCQSSHRKVELCLITWSLAYYFLWYVFVLLKLHRLREISLDLTFKRDGMRAPRDSTVVGERDCMPHPVLVGVCWSWQLSKPAAYKPLLANHACFRCLCIHEFQMLQSGIILSWLHGSIIINPKWMYMNVLSGCQPEWVTLSLSLSPPVPVTVISFVVRNGAMCYETILWYPHFNIHGIDCIQLTYTLETCAHFMDKWIRHGVPIHITLAVQQGPCTLECPTAQSDSVSWEGV